MNWTTTDLDKELFAKELDSFVPERIFDAHAHLYDSGHFRKAVPPLVQEGPRVVEFATFQEKMQEITPGRHTSGLFFGWPDLDIDLEGENNFLIREARRDAGSRGQMIVRPDLDPEFIRETVRRERFVGLKCYHCYAPNKPTWNAMIPEYLPEEQVRIAHEEGLSITLHMVRARAMADASNQEVLRAWGEKYPNARFILAHAARGFNPNHTIEGIGALRGLRNMWCDTSAVTDGGAFEAIVRTLGVDRLLYGSDFPVTHIRGRCVGIGDSFLWLSAENTQFGAGYGAVEPTLVGIESLRTLKTACLNLGLTDSQVEAIFYANAAELFGLHNSN